MKRSRILIALATLIVIVVLFEATRRPGDLSLWKAIQNPAILRDAAIHFANDAKRIIVGETNE